MTSLSVIADFPRLVLAIQESDLLHVIVSRIIHESDEEFAPVVKALNERSWSLKSSELRNDETMWFGQAYYVTVQFGENKDVDNRSIFERLEVT